MNKPYSKLNRNVTAWAFALILIGVISQWFWMNKQLLQMKKIIGEELSKNVPYEEISPIVLQGTVVKDSKHVLIDVSELNKINKHMQATFDVVSSERFRAESIIDKDLERLNLYITIGIGFIGLLGVFLPLIVNVSSQLELKQKQTEIENDLRKFQDERAMISLSLRNGEKSATNICNLNVQNAIARFFNVSSIISSEAARTGNYAQFINLLKSVQSALSECRSHKQHIIVENENFQLTLADFVTYIRREEFRISPVISNRSEIIAFEKLATLIEVLANSNQVSEDFNYRSVIDQLNVIIRIYREKGTI